MENCQIAMTLPYNLIKEKLFDLIERTFYKKEGKPYLACNDKKAFFFQFNVPFKIISLIETSHAIGGAKREYPGKTT